MDRARVRREVIDRAGPAHGQRLCLRHRLTREMTKNIEVSPATLKRVRSVLNDQQTIELIGTISGYNMVSRFAVATGLEVE